MKKLVRDLIPQLFSASKKANSYYYQAGEKEFSEFLKKKLLEEVNEFIESESEEELADILEVIDALYTTYQFDKTHVGKIKDQKRTEWGAFEKKLILVIDE
jgi:predicted house-cleaning noncanonical NTP pyrophosphatase (MazG superfamily)